ncbi:MAG TPA: DinB family protein [Bryobacteraceae bacterium]|nr:DinB family protein [Bryobacteraceae bacterium]
MTKNLLTLLLLAGSAFAQAALHESMVKHWKTTEEFTLAVAQAMPADGYGFKPVPEELSFGQLMVQIAAANVGACSIASGLTAPPTPEHLAAALKDEKVNVEKDAAIKFLTDTFDFCNEAVGSMTPEKMDAVVGRSRKMTGFEWMWAYFTHTAHHRGQAEVYLRVKGIKPPDYKF